MNNNLNLKVTTNMDKATNSMKKFKNALSGTGTAFNGANKNLNRLQGSFRNLNADANRSTTAIKGFGKSLGGANFLANIYMINRLAMGFAKCVNSTMDMIEVTNLFNVAMGTMATETNKALVELSELSGLDLTNLQQAVGTYNLLARSMGFSAEQASILSMNTTKLALDLSSLTNIPFEQAMADLKSGLIGQTETVYKYGIDLTEATLKQEAMNLGIEKSVRNMGQGEKMALRYSVMIRQTALAQGDFANTIEQPANQLRLLKENFVTLARSIGSVFIPILSRVLPYLRAIVMVLSELFSMLASVLGFMKPTIEDTGGSLGGVSDDLDSVGDSADKTAKKLKQLQAPFDELNALNDDSSSGADGALSGMGVDGLSEEMLATLREYDNLLGNVKQKANEIRDKIMEWLGFQKQVNDETGETYWKLSDIAKLNYKPLTDSWNKFVNSLNFVKMFFNETGKDFYNEFLKPVGDWVLSSEGLPRFFNITSDLISKIDWLTLLDSLKTLYGSLSDLAIIAFDALLDFYDFFLAPLINWTFSDAIPQLAYTLSYLIDNIDWKSLNSALEKFWKYMSNFTIGFGQGLINFFKDVCELSVPIINDFIKAFDIFATTLSENDPSSVRAWGESLGEFAGSLLMFASVAGLATKGIEFAGYVSTFIVNMTTAFSQGNFTMVATVIFGKIIEAVEAILPENVKVIIGNILAGFTGGATVGAWVGMLGGPFGALAGAIVGTLIGALWEELKLLPKYIYTKTCELMKSTFSWDNTKEIFNMAYESFSKGGIYIIEGIIEGIVGAFSFIIEPIHNFLMFFVDEFKKVWGIHSPSTEMMPLGEFILLGVVEGLISQFGRFIEVMTEWWDTCVQPWFTSEKWATLWEIVKTAFTDGWNSIKSWWKTSALSLWWTEDVSPYFNGSKWNEMVSIIKTSITNAWGTFTSWWKENGVSKWFENDVKKWFEKETWIDAMRGIQDAFEVIWKGTINTGITLVNQFIDWLNDTFAFEWESVWVAGIRLLEGGSIKLINLPKIPLLERGGMLENGVPFIAGENGKSEMLGSHQGKTTVMPLENTGFVEAIHEAVFSAVAGAMGEGANNTSNIENILMLDGETIYRNQQKIASNKGAKLGSISFQRG